MLDLTKHQNNVGLVLQEGSRLINSGAISQEDDAEIRKQMKLLNDMWENLRLKAVERQAKLHECLMKLQNEQLSQMDNWLTAAETRIQKIHQLADSLEGLIEQKDELSQLQDDLVKEQEAVDCLKQIIVVVDDNTDDQAFTDLENKLSSLSDRWSNVCKFVGNRWFTVQDLIIKLQSIDSDFNDLNTWISHKSIQLNHLIRKTKPMVVKNKINVVDKFTDKQLEEEKQLDSKIRQQLIDEYDSIEFTSSMQLIKILKEIEFEMQAMHAKLNDMNEIGEQIGTQLNNSPQLSNSINNKMDILECKWNSLLEQMEYLSRVCTEQQQIEIKQQLLVKQQYDQKMSSVTTTVSDTVSSAASVLVDAVDDDVSLATISADAVKKRRTITNEPIIVSTAASGGAEPPDESIDQLDHKKIELFVSQLNKVFDNIHELVMSDDLSSEEQQEVIKVTNY